MKKYVIPLLLGLILFGFGCCYLWFEITDFSFINEVPYQKLEEAEESYEFPLLNEGKYRIIGEDGFVELKTSDTLQDKILITVSYYKEFGPVRSRQNSFYEQEAIKNIIFYRSEDSDWIVLKHIKKMLLNDIKDRTIHNYNLLVQPRIVVTVPNGWEENVKIISNDDRMVDFFDEEM